MIPFPSFLRPRLRLVRESARRWHSSRAGAAVLVACALVAGGARAAFSLKVTPIPITIADGATSTMAEVSNEGEDTVRLQVQAFDWSQSPSGEDTLTASTEILVFPSMIAIPPHGARKVRIGTQGGYGAAEKSFRVIFAEVPRDSTPIDAKADVVNVVAHMSIPLFVKPPGVAGSIKVESLTASPDRVHFLIHNVGNAHAMIEKIHLQTLDGVGQTLGTADVAGWYVLPGQSRPFDVDLAQSGLKCAGAGQLLVTAVSRESGRATAGIDHPACSSPR